tara:strand:+ start:12 stop:908 length:897 start_codon:yes stop_codon:yes gene_type:complete
MHSECLTGDAFGSLRCDCRPQLEAALSRISEEGEGVVVYLRQEGRGIGLVNKLKAYNLQDGGLDTVEANEKLGFPADLRNYGVGAQILTDLGIKRLKLLTNNPRKIAGLGGYGLHVESRVPLVICPGDHNAAYLEVKRDKLGHLIDENKQTNFSNERQNIVVFWDGNLTNSELKHFENKANKWSENHFLNISIQNTPRLMALCENPLFIWNVRHRDIKSHLERNLIDKRLLESLLKELCNWDKRERIGIIKTNNYEQMLHPSQNILIETNNINDLVNIESSPLFDWNLKDKTSMIVWS